MSFNLNKMSYIIAMHQAIAMKEPYMNNNELAEYNERSKETVMKEVRNKVGIAFDV